jgi:hypothetical protein
MQWLAEEIEAYRQEKEDISAEARRRAALFLSCGVDLPQALSGSAADRERIVARLQRMIERERMKGAGRHWSYDLNRHIAMKQALDRLREQDRGPMPATSSTTSSQAANCPGQQNGARRRRLP